MGTRWWGWSEELGEQCSRCGRRRVLDAPVVHVTPGLGHDRVGEVQAAADAVAAQPVVDVGRQCVPRRS